ncbi:MAG: prepilin-type N-terminal cleavage/methylation domain-containing protein [Rhodanobacteraceae bacterium]
MRAKSTSPSAPERSIRNRRRAFTRSRVPGPGSRFSKGFTLLEILLALALLALVMLGVWSALAGAARITHSADALMARSESVHTAQQFLRRYLAAAGMHPWVTEAGAGTRARVFAGDATSMQYVAPLPMQSGHAGLYLQSLQIEKQDGGGMTLWLAYQPYLANVPARGEPVRHKLLTDLDGGNFQYLGGGAFGKPAGWRNDWTDANGLPLAVRILLKPGWRARVPIPEMLIPLHSGEGAGTQTGGAQ